MRQASTSNSPDAGIAINKYLNTAYDNVLLVANNIEKVVKVSDFIENGSLDKIETNLDSLVIVANDIGQIITVAGITDEVVVVANIQNDVVRVSSNLDDILRVRQSILEVERVSASADNLDRVHASIDKLDRVFASIDNVDSVLDNLPNIDTVALSIMDVKTVATNIVNVNTVADNMDAVVVLSTNIEDVLNASSFVSEIRQAVTDTQASAQEAANSAVLAGQEADASAQSAVESEQSNVQSAANALATSQDKAAITQIRNEVEADRQEVVNRESNVTSLANQVTQDKSTTLTYRNEAEAAKNLARLWAVGNIGSGNSTPSDTNNAHYYSEIARINANQTFKSGGYFTPTTANPYPNVTNVEVDTIWLIKFDSEITVFTYTSGELAGKTVKNGYMLVYDTPADSFDFIPTSLTGVSSINGIFADAANNLTLTAADVGALALTGGIIQGTVSFASNGVTLVSVHDRNKTAAYWRNIHAQTRLGILPNKLTRYDEATNTEYKVFDEGNPPTASEVGAVPSTGDFEKQGNLQVIGHVATSQGFRSTSLWSEESGNSFMMKVGTYQASKGDLLEIRPCGAGASNKTAGFDVWTTYNDSKTNLFEKGQRVYSPNNIPSALTVGALPSYSLSFSQGQRYACIGSIAKTDSNACLIVSGTGDYGAQVRDIINVTIASRTNEVRVEANRFKRQESYAYDVKLFTKDTGSRYELWIETSTYQQTIKYALLSETGWVDIRNGQTATLPDGLTEHTINTIYTTANKPSATDVGAVVGTTKAAFLPAGTTAQRPVAGDFPANTRAMRFNVETGEWEGLDPSGNITPIGGGGVPPFIEKTASFTVEKKKAYKLKMVDGVNKVVTVPDGFANDDWFVVSTLEWDRGLAGLTATVQFGTEVLTNGQEDFDGYVIDRPCVLYFLKSGGKWTLADGIGVDGSYNALEKRVDELEKYPTPWQAVDNTDNPDAVRWTLPQNISCNFGETHWRWKDEKTIEINGMARVYAQLNGTHHRVMKLPDVCRNPHTVNKYLPWNCLKVEALTFCEVVAGTNEIGLYFDAASLYQDLFFMFNWTIPVERV